MSAHSDNGMNELDLQSALHVLVHPDMGLAVRIVKRPGAELIDIALIVTGVPAPQPESPRHGRRQSPKEEEAPCPCKWVSSYLQPPFGMSAANLIRSSVNDFALRR